MQNNYREEIDGINRFKNWHTFFRAFVIDGTIYQIQTIDGVTSWVSVKTVVAKNHENYLSFGEIRPIEELIELRKIVIDKIING